MSNDNRRSSSDISCNGSGGDQRNISGGYCSDSSSGESGTGRSTNECSDNNGSGGSGNGSSPSGRTDKIVEIIEQIQLHHILQVSCSLSRRTVL